MTSRSRSRKGTATAAGLAVLVASLLLGAFSATAFGAPTNTALPTISPATPKVSKTATATTGTWNSESPAHWFEGESVQLKEGEKVNVTAHGNPITFAATVSGASGSITCQTTVTGASLENPSGGGAGIGSAEIEYKNCTAGGGWSTCTATFGAAVPVKLALSTVEGKAKIALSPAGADLGAFTLSGCEIGNTYKLIGVINGFYSNAGSRIEFDPGTSGTGALRLQSKVGPKTSATGTIELETSKGGDVKADSLTYEYAWKRCFVGCEAISGATSSTYTPVAADQGKKLKVSVTATDSTGSTAVDSDLSNSVTASLSWYVCGEWGGTGVYEDANCTKKGASNPYSWLRTTSTPFTSSNVLADGKAQGYYINWTWTGVEFDIYCTEGSGEGTLSSAEDQASVDGYKLTLSNCELQEPACDLKDSKLVFNAMSASSPKESSNKLNPELNFKPQAGSALAEFSLINCEIAATYKFVGSFPALMNNEGSYIKTTWQEVHDSEDMRLQSSNGPVVGMTTVNRVLSEGKKPVKLDIEP